MPLPIEIKNRLGHLAHQLGSSNELDLLNVPTVMAACSHGDAVVGIRNESYRFEIPDIIGDYTVFNRRLEEKYTETPTDNLWGMSETDLVWMVQVPKGDYFYLAYESAEGDRLVMVVRA